MARTSNHSAEDTNLLRILKEKADQYGEAEVKMTEIGLEYGISNRAVRQSMGRLKEKGYLDFEYVNNGRAGHYFRVWIIDQNKVEPKTLDEIMEEEPVKMRVCKHCGSKAFNEDARFCWKCGASLLSDKELLKEAFDRVFPKIAKLSTDSVEMNEIMTVIGKVGKMAFEEVSA